MSITRKQRRLQSFRIIARAKTASIEHRNSMNPMQAASLGTAQEAFWAGQFGDEYIARNNAAHAVAERMAFFLAVLDRTGPLKSVLELGANIGLNLRALRALLPATPLSAIEINSKAAGALRDWGELRDVFETSILTFDGREQYDLTFTKGVLIHIAPAELPRAYDVLYRSSRRYVLVAEYYNPTPVSVDYRGNHDRLFKRDFAGDLLERYSDLSLIDYGFRYHRDPLFPQDDMTWFLLAKTSPTQPS